MHNIFHENAKNGEIFHLFRSLLGSRSKLVLNGGLNPQVNSDIGGVSSSTDNFQLMHIKMSAW